MSWPRARPLFVSVFSPVQFAAKTYLVIMASAQSRSCGAIRDSSSRHSSTLKLTYLPLFRGASVICGLLLVVAPTRAAEEAVSRHPGRDI